MTHTSSLSVHVSCPLKEERTAARAERTAAERAANALRRAEYELAQVRKCHVSLNHWQSMQMLYSALTPPVCFFTNANKSIVRLSALHVVSVVAWWALRVSLVVRRLVPARLYLPLQHGHREHNTRSSLKYLRSLIRYTHTHTHTHTRTHKERERESVKN